MLTDLAIFALLAIGFALLPGLPLLGGLAWIGAFEIARRCGMAETGGLEAFVFTGAIVGIVIFYVQEL